MQFLATTKTLLNAMYSTHLAEGAIAFKHNVKTSWYNHPRCHKCTRTTKCHPEQYSFIPMMPLLAS